MLTSIPGPFRFAVTTVLQLGIRSVADAAVTPVLGGGAPNLSNALAFIASYPATKAGDVVAWGREPLAEFQSMGRAYNGLGLTVVGLVLYKGMFGMLLSIADSAGFLEGGLPARISVVLSVTSITALACLPLENLRKIKLYHEGIDHFEAWEKLRRSAGGLFSGAREAVLKGAAQTTIGVLAHAALMA